MFLSPQLPCSDNDLCMLTNRPESKECKRKGSGLGSLLQELGPVRWRDPKLPVLPCGAHNSKLMTSDYVCAAEGINEVKRRIMHHYFSAEPTAFNNGNAKVAAVESSHSAFSAAWMCLNKISFPEGVVNPKSFLKTRLPPKLALPALVYHSS